MEAVLELLVVLPSAVMVVAGALRGFWIVPAEWKMAEPARTGMERRRPVLVHDSAREKLLRSVAPRPSRAAGERIRLVYNGG